MEREIEIVGKLKSENIVSLKEIFEIPNSYFIVSELCYLNLKEYLKIRENGLTIDKIREILLDLNKGFREMNDNNS